MKRIYLQLERCNLATEGRMNFKLRAKHMTYFLRK